LSGRAIAKPSILLMFFQSADSLEGSIHERYDRLEKGATASAPLARDEVSVVRRGKKLDLLRLSYTSVK